MSEKLYLIPGTMCDERLWADLVAYLPPSVDLDYLSIPPDKDLDDIVEYYHELFASTLAEQDKINLVGFSLGGYIASYFASIYPERVNKLFVISNSPTSLPLAEIKQRNETIDFINKYGYQGISRHRITHLLDEESDSKRIVDVISAMDKSLGQKVLLSQYQNTSQRKNLSKELASAKFTIHFYCSERDPLVNAMWFSSLNSNNPDFSLIKTSGSGHMLPLEKPQELARYLKLWLAL